MISAVHYLALVAANGVFLAAMYLIPYVIWASIDDNLKQAIEFKKSNDLIYAIGRYAFFTMIGSLVVLSMYGLCHVVIKTA